MPSFKRVYWIAIKIFGANIIFGGILIGLSYMSDPRPLIIVSLWLIPLMIAIAVYFILEETENIMKEKLQV